VPNPASSTVTSSPAFAEKFQPSTVTYDPIGPYCGSTSISASPSTSKSAEAEYPEPPVSVTVIECSSTGTLGMYTFAVNLPVDFTDTGALRTQS
jgi:hypothetical protein